MVLLGGAGALAAPYLGVGVPVALSPPEAGAMTVRELIAVLLEAVDDGAMALDSKVDVAIPVSIEYSEMDVTGIAYCIAPDKLGRRGWVTLELDGG